MIRPLRCIHLAVWCTLTVLLPALLIAAIAVRGVK